MEVLRSANQLEESGRSILHLEVGEPGFNTPEKVIRVAKTMLDEELLGYTEALGKPELRARIAKHYAEYYGVGIAPNRVVVTAGASGAFLLSFLDHCFINPALLRTRYTLFGLTATISCPIDRQYEMECVIYRIHR